MVHAAVQTLNGDTSDQEKLSEAIAKVRISTPRGPISFYPETNNVVQNIYVRQVADVGGALHDRVLATYADVRDPGD